MIGRAKVELFNAKTGRLEQRVEQHNMVTNAIKYVMNICAACGGSLNNDVFPIAQNALGGLMLFDEELTEDVENINFPPLSANGAHLVAYADVDTNSTDINRGSFNLLESAVVENGYKTVWDFGTSQANGTIKSAVRTHLGAGANPLTRYIGLSDYTRNTGAPSTDYGWCPIRYDGEYVYLTKKVGNVYRIARCRRNMQTMRVLDRSDYAGTIEQVAEINAEVYSFTYSYNGEARNVSVECTDPTYIYDGHDGYLYFFAGGYEGSTNTCTKISYFTVRYDDDSWEKSATVTFTVPQYLGGISDYYLGWQSGQHVYASYLSDQALIRMANGYLYLISADRKSILQINMANHVDQHAWRLIASGSSDYIQNLQRWAPYSGGVPFTIYHYLSNSTEWRNGFLFEDGVNLILSIAGTENNPVGREWYSMLRCYDSKLAYFGYRNEYNIYNGYIRNYIGTIANLATPIEKNASQTMKITYTLTDVEGT